MIYKRRNGQNFTGKHGLKKKNETVSEITAMLELLGVESKYFKELLGIDAYSFSGLTEDLPVCLWVHDEYYAIVHGNSRFLKNYGNCIKQTCYQHLMGENTHCSCCLSRRAFRDNRPQICKFCKRNDSGYELHSFHIPVTNRHGDRFILKSSYHVDGVEELYRIYSDRKEEQHNEGQLPWQYPGEAEFCLEAP